MAPKTLTEAGVDEAGIDRVAGTRLGLLTPHEPSRRGKWRRSGIAREAPRGLARRLRDMLAAEPEQRTAVSVAVLGALALAALSLTVGHEAAPRGDDLIYERMATDPLGTHTFPFAYRIGIPWLVHVLPFSHTLSFELLAWISAGAAAGFAYLLMRRLGAARGLAGALALALALSPPMLVVALRAGRNPDAATMLFLMAGTLFAVERRTRALAATLALGVLVREAELFVIPLAYALWSERWWDRRAARRALAVGAPALAAFLALRFAIPTIGGAQVPGYGGPLLGARLSLLGTGARDGLVEARRALSVYGPLWIAAPLALGGMRYARRGLVLVAACLLSMTFALDWGRMIFLAAPVFYPAGAFTLGRHPRWRIPALVALALLIAAYALHMSHGGLRAGIDESPPPPYPVR
jgi:hypothetical protein